MSTLDRGVAVARRHAPVENRKTSRQALTRTVNCEARTWMLMGYFRSIPPELEEHAMALPVC